MKNTNRKQVKATLEDLIAKKLQKNSTEKFFKYIYKQNRWGINI